jgi:hypothetical protein
MKAARVEEWCADYAQRRRVEERGLDSLILDDGWVLRDGNHRCCAIYMLDPSDWEVSLDGRETLPGNLDALPGLS